MSYRIEIKKSAEKEIGSLPNNIKERVKKAILSLAKNPMPVGHKKLKGRTNDYRVRVGDYRIVYQIKAEIILIYIIKVGHRKDIYE